MEEDNNKTLYEIGPRFNFIYELFMPTGKKIKSTILLIVIMIVLIIVALNYGVNTSLSSVMINNDISLFDALIVLCYISIGLLIIKLIFHIVFQTLQYKYIKYTFFEKYMVYEDSFLNQHKKNIQYTNIKEVEIRRSIWDRILGYGLIVIYTNAENEFSNGLIIYSIKNPKVHYNKIEAIIHSGKDNKIQNQEIKQVINGNNQIENKTENIESSQEFKDELKNINK